MSDETQEWAEALCHATGDVIGLIDFDKASNPDKYPEEYNAIAWCIVEPPGVTDSYGEFLENDPQNWKGFVASTLGANWGRVADAVLDYGY